MTTCDRCGHEHDTRWLPNTWEWVVACIDYLRADLAQSRKMELDAETRACAAEERARALAQELERLRGPLPDGS